MINEFDAHLVVLEAAAREKAARGAHSGGRASHALLGAPCAALSAIAAAIANLPANKGATGIGGLVLSVYGFTLR